MGQRGFRKHLGWLNQDGIWRTFAQGADGKLNFCCRSISGRQFSQHAGLGAKLVKPMLGKGTPIITTPMVSSQTDEGTLSSGRTRAMRYFLWLSVTSAGIGLGAKLFDLLVVAKAWGASPPASFVHLPYGKDFPIDPGAFFQPLSVVMLIGIIGTLVTGWKSRERAWLWAAAIIFAVIWAITPTIFWPMISEMWSIHKGRVSSSEAEVLSLVRRWFIWDSIRLGLIAMLFLSSLRALAGCVHPKHQNA